MLLVAPRIRQRLGEAADREIRGREAVGNRAFVSPRIIATIAAAIYTARLGEKLSFWAMLLTSIPITGLMEAQVTSQPNWRL